MGQSKGIKDFERRMMAFWQGFKQFDLLSELVIPN
jgi:hypothetical protein